MSQVDWLIDSVSDLKEGQSVVSIVSSGDIDSVLIHLFAMSYMWPRYPNGKFVHDVYVILEKPGKLFDVYNITSMIEVLEGGFNKKHIGMKVSMTLCLGGNDFLPKFHGISHKSILQMFFEHKDFLDNLFIIPDNIEDFDISTKVYLNLMKCVYALLATGCTF